MKKLLWVGDAGCPSGFARCTHEVLDTLQMEYNVTVLGLNYRGDPLHYAYDVWAAAAGGDLFGVKRLIWMCDILQRPDVIVILNDGWNIPAYVQQLKRKLSNGEYAWPEYASIPIIAIVAVDGQNFQGEWLKDVDHTIFWTQWALNEARQGGFEGEASVIPLGVNIDLYKPMEQAEALALKKIDGFLGGKFVVGNVNRNQHRKRWDLTIKYFSNWIYRGMPVVLRNGENMAITDAFLYLHIAPTGDDAVNVRQLCNYYSILSRLALVEPPIFYGLTEDDMRVTYNCFDVAISTTQGEGMGLTTLEAMACRRAVIVPDWAALGDWPRGAAYLVPCTSTAIGPPYINVLGGVADEERFIRALDQLYHNREILDHNAQAALERSREERFRWETIGQQYVMLLSNVIAAKEFDHARASRDVAESQDAREAVS